jgi:hypothetical protein
VRRLPRRDDVYGDCGTKSYRDSGIVQGPANQRTGIGGAHGGVRDGDQVQSGPSKVRSDVGQ